MTTILEDPRPITALMYAYHMSYFAKVEEGGHTKIEAYREFGEEPPDLWLRVYVGDKVVSRIAARHVEIHYAHSPAFFEMKR